MNIDIDGIKDVLAQANDDSLSEHERVSAEQLVITRYAPALVKEIERLQAALDQAQADYADAHGLGAAEALEKLQAENAELRQAINALLVVQWAEDWICPWCSAPKYDNCTGDFIGHAPGCPRQKAAALVVAEQKPASPFRAARGVLPWQPGDELPENVIKKARTE